MGRMWPAINPAKPSFSTVVLVTSSPDRRYELSNVEMGAPAGLQEWHGGQGRFQAGGGPRKCRCVSTGATGPLGAGVRIGAAKVRQVISPHNICGTVDFNGLGGRAFWEASRNLCDEFMHVDARGVSLDVCACMEGGAPSVLSRKGVVKGERAVRLRLGRTSPEREQDQQDRNAESTRAGPAGLGMV
jgi:hypothetical protein